MHQDADEPEESQEDAAPAAPSASQTTAAKKLLRTWREVLQRREELLAIKGKASVRLPAQRKLEALTLILANERVSQRQLDDWLRPPKKAELNWIRSELAHRYVLLAVHWMRHDREDWDREARLRSSLRLASKVVGRPPSEIADKIRFEIEHGEIRDGNGPVKATYVILEKLDFANRKTVRAHIERRRAANTSTRAGGAGSSHKGLQRPASSRKEIAAHGSSKTANSRGGR